MESKLQPMVKGLLMDDASILRRHGIEPDPVIEFYNNGVDRALLRRNLRRTPEERFRRAEALQKLAAELRQEGRLASHGELNALLDERQRAGRI